MVTFTSYINIMCHIPVFDCIQKNTHLSRETTGVSEVDFVGIPVLTVYRKTLTHPGKLLGFPW